MSEIIDKIQKLESTLNNNKVELAKLEERKKGLSEEKEKYLAQLKELKVDEDNLEITIIDMEQELNKEIEKIENELN